MPRAATPVVPRLHGLSLASLTQAQAGAALEEHVSVRLPRLEKLWAYYRNPLRATLNSGARWYALGQECGLPGRITGRGPRDARDARADDRAPQREAVIENDIAWRVQTMVDFLLARPVRIASTARDEGLRGTIERVLDSVWEAAGGIALLQDMALLGHVYGHVDLALRVDDAIVGVRGEAGSLGRALDAAAMLAVELIEPRRGVPVLDPHDYRRVRAYIVHHEGSEGGAERRPGFFERLLPRMGVLGAPSSPGALTEVLTPEGRQVFRGGTLVYTQGRSFTAGALPVVHVQNIAEPFSFEGQGEVEPLIPLQDELNTRLSDRAYRVTMQSFKMYLLKGIDPAQARAVGPGSMWSSDNPEAGIEEFGGDGASPSEDAHIRQVREAMDKASGVPPLASGVVQAKIGNLSSANALRITLMAILSKTARKRVTYGGGIERMCRLVLAALHECGALPTEEADRGVRIVWPDPLPIDEQEQIAAAEGKVRLGVPRERVLAELGYGPADAGVT